LKQVGCGCISYELTYLIISVIAKYSTDVLGFFTTTMFGLLKYFKILYIAYIFFLAIALFEVYL